MRRRRWRSNGGSSSSKKKVIFIVLVLFTFMSLQTFIYIERNLRPTLLNIAKIRVKQIATHAINTAISERIAHGSNLEKLVDWRTDNSGKITGFMLNYAEHMKITSEAVGVVEKILDRLEKVPELIPIGQAMDSAILASFGPDIPIRLVPAGAVEVHLNTRQKDAGINMLLVEVYIRILVEVTIIIPFDAESEFVETEIPISYLLVVGDVPMYYIDNKGSPIGKSNPLPPNVTLPNVTSGPTGQAAGE